MPAAAVGAEASEKENTFAQAPKFLPYNIRLNPYRCWGCIRKWLSSRIHGDRDQSPLGVAPSGYKVSFGVQTLRGPLV